MICDMADEGRGGTGMSDVHPDIIQTHILTRLDGPSLASASGASSPLHHLSAQQNLWKNLCNSSWPSTGDTSIQRIISGFSSAHRSFYADSFPAILLNSEKPRHLSTSSAGASRLISAVDIHYGDQLLYSKASETETSSGWFACSPFRIDLFAQKETVPTPLRFDKCMSSLEESMRLSWILIDTEKKRAVNLSSTRPVEVRRHWLSGEIQVRYMTVMAATGGYGGGDFVNCKVTVTCGAKEGGEMLVKEVSMQVEDMEGKTVIGKDSLVILHQAMEGKRRKGQVGEEKRIYETFLEKRREWRERKQSTEKRKDMACVAAGVAIFLAFWIHVLFK